MKLFASENTHVFKPRLVTEMAMSDNAFTGKGSRAHDGITGVRTHTHTRGTKEQLLGQSPATQQGGGSPIFPYSA